MNRSCGLRCDGFFVRKTIWSWGQLEDRDDTNNHAISTQKRRNASQTGQITIKQTVKKEEISDKLPLNLISIILKRVTLIWRKEREGNGKRETSLESRKVGWKKSKPKDSVWRQTNIGIRHKIIYTTNIKPREKIRGRPGKKTGRARTREKLTTE